ncbi:MAG: hypothetical protein CMJ25_30850 [Phycisphaerae bacterium]|nr:hypothetical protein [Phycisphaerae bacterium]
MLEIFILIQQRMSLKFINLVAGLRLARQVMAQQIDLNIQLQLVKLLFLEQIIILQLLLTIADLRIFI